MRDKLKVEFLPERPRLTTKLNAGPMVRLPSAGVPLEPAPDPERHLGCRDGKHLLFWSGPLKQGDIVSCAYCRTPFEFQQGALGRKE